jgi:hypothetical protein
MEPLSDTGQRTSENKNSWPSLMYGDFMAFLL